MRQVMAPFDGGFGLVQCAKRQRIDQYQAERTSVLITLPAGNMVRREPQTTAYLMMAIPAVTAHSSGGFATGTTAAASSFPTASVSARTMAPTMTQMAQTPVRQVDPPPTDFQPAALWRNTQAPSSVPAAQTTRIVEGLNAPATHYHPTTSVPPANATAVSTTFPSAILVAQPNMQPAFTSHNQLLFVSPVPAPPPAAAAVTPPSLFPMAAPPPRPLPTGQPAALNPNSSPNLGPGLITNVGCVRQRESIYYGVSWHKRLSKWEARMRAGGRQHHFGTFDDEQTAAMAVDTFIRMHGLAELRGLNFVTTAEKQRGIRLAHRSPRTPTRYSGVSVSNVHDAWEAALHVGNQRCSKLPGAHPGAAQQPTRPRSRRVRRPSRRTVDAIQDQGTDESEEEEERPSEGAAGILTGEPEVGSEEEWVQPGL